MGLLPCPYALIAPSDPQVCSQVVAHWSMSLWKQKKSTHQLLTKSKTSPEVGSLFEKRIGPSAAQGSHLRVLGTAWGVDRCLPFSTWKPPGSSWCPCWSPRCSASHWISDGIHPKWSKCRDPSWYIWAQDLQITTFKNDLHFGGFASGYASGLCFGVCFGGMLRKSATCHQYISRTTEKYTNPFKRSLGASECFRSGMMLNKVTQCLVPLDLTNCAKTMQLLAPLPPVFLAKLWARRLESSFLGVFRIVGVRTLRLKTVCARGWIHNTYKYVLLKTVCLEA